jgi:GNAT superfamily N-acetyltransferase
MLHKRAKHDGDTVQGFERLADMAIVKARSEEEIAAVRTLVWEFFDLLRERYPEMLDKIDAYIESQNVAGQLADFGTYFQPPNGECFLAMQDGQPAGIVMLKPRGDGDAEMNRMYVRGAARGLGLGRQLAEAAVAEARRMGCGTLWLGALHRHVEALPLYRSLGFERYHDPGEFGADDDRVIHMKLVLAARA